MHVVPFFGPPPFSGPLPFSDPPLPHLPPPQASQGGQPALALLSVVLYVLLTLCFGLFTMAMIITMLTQAYHASSMTAR